MKKHTNDVHSVESSSRNDKLPPVDLANRSREETEMKGDDGPPLESPAFVDRNTLTPVLSSTAGKLPPATPSMTPAVSTEVPNIGIINGHRRA